MQIIFFFFKWEHPFLTVNYSIDNCSDKFDVSELKFVQVVFKFFNFVF